jgi:hypothetical protein
MGREYFIATKPPSGDRLNTLLRRLPSPIKHLTITEIYNYRVDPDGYYFVDHLVDRTVAATALLVFIDDALSRGEARISEP